MAEKPKSPPAPAVTSGPSPAGGRARKVVLVVEDDLAIRTLVVRALSSRYDVFEASDGMVASELLSTMPRPDLLVCDVMMPTIDGFSLARMLRADSALKALPIIFLTAKSSPADVVKGIQLGAKHYVQKPFSVTELMDKVAKVLEGAAAG